MDSKGPRMSEEGHYVIIFVGLQGWGTNKAAGAGLDSLSLSLATTPREPELLQQRLEQGQLWS